MNGVEGNDDASDQGGPIVGGFEAGSAEERGCDSDSGSSGGDGVAAVMPGIDEDGGATDLATGTRFVSIHRFFYDNNEQKNDERKSGRGLVRSSDFFDGLPCDEKGRSDQHDRHRESGEWFCFSVAIGMILVRRFGSQDKSGPDNGGADHVAQRFDGVGNERVGVSGDSGG